MAQPMKTARPHSNWCDGFVLWTLSRLPNFNGETLKQNPPVEAVQRKERCNWCDLQAPSEQVNLLWFGRIFPFDDLVAPLRS